MIQNKTKISNPVRAFLENPLWLTLITDLMDPGTFSEINDTYKILQKNAFGKKHFEFLRGVQK